MFRPKVHLCPNPLPPLSDKWLKGGFLLQSFKVQIDVIVDLKLFTTGTNVITVYMCTVRERNEIWFKTSSNGDRRSNIYMQAVFKKESLDTGICIIFFCKFMKDKGMSQNVGLFHLENGLA